MGRSLHVKLKRAFDGWTQTRDDAALLAAVGVLADEFGKERPMSETAGGLRREDLELICFEHITA